MPYCLIALLPYCLIALLAISLVACKGSGGGSSSNSSTTTPTINTTPLEGTWSASETAGTATATMKFTFTGSNVVLSMITTDTNPPTGTPAMTTIAISGTFRVDNGNLYAKFTTITYCDSDDPTPVTITTTPSSAPVIVDSNEHLLGAYAINGNILTLSDSSDPSADPLTFTKL